MSLEVLESLSNGLFFLMDNITLKVVRTHFYFPDQTNVFMITDFYPVKGPNFGDFFISEEIVKILTHCKSLETFGFPCNFVSRNTMCSLNETAAVINARFLNLEDVILVGDSLTTKVNKFCKVTGIRIEINREQKMLTFNIISLELGPDRIKATKVQEGKVIQCHEEEWHEPVTNDPPTCFFEHRPFLNEQVKNLTISKETLNGCEECWCNLFKSFPNIRNIYCKTFLNASTLHSISRYLQHIKTLHLKFAGSLKDWSPIPSLRSLSIELYSMSTTLEEDNYVSRNCPGLTSLCVHLGTKKAILVAYKEFLQNLREKWKEIKELTIDDMIRTNAQDLTAMEHCFSELRVSISKISFDTHEL